MSTDTDAEMDAALDALESDAGTTFEDLDNEGQPQKEEAQDTQGSEEKVTEEAEGGEEAPPGYIGYEDWVASGKDPKKFRGEDAYSAQYDQIQETRDVKTKLSSMEETLKHVVTANEEWRATQMDSMRATVAAELEAAKDASDVDGALAAQTKLDSLNVQPAQAPQQQHPLIADFRQKNPMTDKESPRFNADFNADVEGFYDSMVNDLTRNGQRAMTDSQITRCLSLAQKKAQELSPDLFKSTRNNRQTLSTTNKKSEKVSSDYRARLKGIGNSKNVNDSNAAVDMYDMLLEGAGGKKAADNFAKTNLGD